MLNVVCLKWGTKYGPEYVNILYSMVERNLTVPFRFVCITDDPSGIRTEVETKPLVTNKFAGWWQKLTFFSDPLYDIEGRVLTLDLDIVIVDNIDDVVSTDGDFCISKDKVPSNGFNSSVMLFDAGKHVDILDDMKIRAQDMCTGVEGEQLVRKRYWGDQVWITEKRPNAVTWPDEWIVSYKLDCTSRQTQKFKVPEHAKIILFHGNPNPPDVLKDIGEFWIL